MCGIIGYVGEEHALPHLLEGLRTLEYRGYDSVGVTVSLGGEEPLLTVKTKGKLRELTEKLKTHPAAADGRCGIGHTRWATHGAPDDKNAHPHTTRHLSLVHNGIIENDAELRAELREAGISLLSDTDTEAAAWLLDRLYADSRDPVDALFRTAERLRGSYAFAVIFKDRPEVIYAMRRDSPLIVARGAQGCALASDVPALLRHSRACARLPEDTVAILRRDGIHAVNRRGFAVSLPTEEVAWDTEQAQKGGYAHFMRKEIDEQPDALRRTLSPRIRDGLPHFSLPSLDTDRIRRVRSLRMIACGTAMHAGLVGKRLIEQLARLPVQVEIASEFRYRDPLLDPAGELCVFLSQSGETADTLAALRHARAAGVPTLAIVNVVGSSVAREADEVLYTLAGPEIAVASTKAYSVQCALLTLLALRLALVNGRMTEEAVRACVRSLCEDVPAAVTATLAMSDRIAALVPPLAACEHLYFIGRGIDADLCTEGSLKLKEISYIHSEAYPAGELKHGTISLIEEGTPVLALMTDPSLSAKTLTAIREVRARGAHVLTVTTAALADALSLSAENVLLLPAIPSAAALPAPFALFPAACALQLLAYHTALARGCHIDQPRNLAKSVTVE
ncbi:MAG: glutamine--fructose-6-phosphate transaminase (isomerizing) [Clostridia bacterium]|nr:glutamine--fructose-6-phosphate transaminase (isomerizing) [Clostridia bacterium]